MGALFLIAFSLGGLGSATAQHVIATGDGLVRVEARGTPLSQLLDEFAQVVSLDLKVEPESGSRRISVSQPAFEPLDALRVLLKDAGVDFLMVGGAPGRPARIVVGGARRVAFDEAQPAPSAPQPADAPAQAQDVAVAVAQPYDEPVGDEPDEAPVVSPEAQKAMLDQLVALMGGTPKAPRRGTLPLPFPDANGKPLTIHSDAKPTDDIQLPFPGADGTSPMTIPRPQPVSVLPPSQTSEEVR